MNFKIEFDDRAYKEWYKLDPAIREQFKKKLLKLQEHPYIPSARLQGDLSNCYKIKLRSSGFRLVYQVLDDEIVILIIAVGKRESKNAYNIASNRLISKD